MSNPAIVIIAYNRAAPLKRLLSSLDSADYSSRDVILHISIDGSENSEVTRVANEFNWQHGKKIIDQQESNLGLLNHVILCGELTEKYGSIIVLEDDLIVSPAFYRFAKFTTNYYSSDPRISGISLFAYPVEESKFYPFTPIRDSDVHFIQIASSWGQSWTSSQWKSFKNWLNENPSGKDSVLPTYVKVWGDNSWKKLYIAYLIDTDRYFVFPNVSYSSNFEEEGTNATQTGLFQVNLCAQFIEPHLKGLDDSNAVYDAHFELSPCCVRKLCPELAEVNFEVDFYGSKPLESMKDLILTSRRSSKWERSYGTKMRPLFLNIVNSIEGEEIGLTRKENIINTEEDRFLFLQTTSFELKQYAEIRGRKMQQVSVVIPLLEEQNHALSSTINDLKTDRFYDVTLLIVSAEANRDSIKEMLIGLGVNAFVISHEAQSIDELLQFGIASCQTEYCSWIMPGMLIDLEKLEDVSRIFRGMSQVNVFHGLQEEVNASNHTEVETFSGRWTPRKVNSNRSDALKIRSELVFWRSSLLEGHELTRLKRETVFFELLNLSPVYLVVMKFGDFNAIRSEVEVSEGTLSELFHKQQFMPHKGLQSVFRLMFQRWFKHRRSFLRMFYKEGKSLPLVIRRDFVHESFYLNND